MLNKIKHFIGNILHIKKWSDNYKRNKSFESFVDAYSYVISKYNYLYKKLENYYKDRHIVCNIIKYNRTYYPQIIITKDKFNVPHKRMSYCKSNSIIYVHPNMLYLNPIEFRSLLVHEIIHHIYRSVNLSYGAFRDIFNKNGKGIYEKDPEEFIADYWRLCYEGYLENDIVKQLAEWYINDDKDCSITKEIVELMEHYGFIPASNKPTEANFRLCEKF